MPTNMAVHGYLRPQDKYLTPAFPGNNLSRVAHGIINWNVSVRDDPKTNEKQDCNKYAQHNDFHGPRLI
ncbi:MAG: hypothetical protein STSR0003_29160 [Smithella sp.]